MISGVFWGDGRPRIPGLVWSRQVRQFLSGPIRIHRSMGLGYRNRRPLCRIKGAGKNNSKCSFGRGFPAGVGMTNPHDSLTVVGMTTIAKIDWTKDHGLGYSTHSKRLDRNGGRSLRRTQGIVIQLTSRHSKTDHNCTKIGSRRTPARNSTITPTPPQCYPSSRQSALAADPKSSLPVAASERLQHMAGALGTAL